MWIKPEEPYIKWRTPDTEGVNEAVNMDHVAGIGKDDYEYGDPSFYSINFYTDSTRIIEWIFASDARRNEVFDQILEQLETTTPSTNDRMLTEDT